MTDFPNLKGLDLLVPPSVSQIEDVSEHKAFDVYVHVVDFSMRKH